jgi:hypothetical protein
MRLGTVALWYSTDFGFSAPLIEKFVSVVEEQAITVIEKHRTEKKTETVVESLGDEDYFGRHVVTFGGFDSDSYDVEGLWEEHFPNMLRRSALITVYSYFEHELVKLCGIVKNEKKLSLAFADLREDGIERAVNYLGKVANLDTKKADPLWSSLAHIKIVRNTIVHRDGRIHDADGKIPDKLSTAAKALPHIKMDDYEVILEAGFVEFAVTSFTHYFKLLDDSIQAGTK